MTWYRFWKRVHGHSCGEKYVYYDTKDLKDKKFYDDEYFKCGAESWANSIPGGHSTSYRYGFEKVKSPPTKWLVKMIKREERYIEESKENIVLYKKELIK